MKTTMLALPLIAAALSVAALSVAGCAKHDDVAANTTTETVTLNEGEVSEVTNFTDAGNAVVPEAPVADNAVAANDTLPSSNAQ